MIAGSDIPSFITKWSPSAYHQSILLQRKVMLSVWWTTASVVHFEFLLSSQTINKNGYSAQLWRAAASLLEKQPSLMKKKRVLFHQDNARWHTGNKSVEVIYSLGWQIIPHPPYFPEVVTSDYHLIQPTDNHVQNLQVQTPEDFEKNRAGLLCQKFDLLQKWHLCPCAAFPEGHWGKWWLLPGIKICESNSASLFSW